MSTSDIVPMIREANINDHIEIHELSHHLKYDPVPSEVAFYRLKNILNSNFDKIWIIKRDGIIQGWIHIFIAHRVASPAFVEIGGLVVSPDSRRGGIGRALVEHVKNWSSEKNFSLRVRCNSKREEAQLFYQSLGFTKSKEQTVYEIIHH